jgi:hypothetical protein
VEGLQFNQDYDLFVNSLLPCNNEDKTINNSGYRLIDFCKATESFIVNGRTDGDLNGKRTFKSISTIDYLVFHYLIGTSQINI